MTHSRKRALKTFLISFFTVLYLYALCFGVGPDTTVNFTIKSIYPSGGPPDLNVWLSDKLRTCGGNFTGYANEFAWLRWAEVDPTRAGIFSIVCSSGKVPHKYPFYHDNSHLTQWMENLRNRQRTNRSSVVNKMALAVNRYEAHNLYHTMTDWYNIFLFSRLFNTSHKEFDVILVDDRPPGHMDETWSILFPSVYNVRKLSKPVVFKDLVWSVLGYESPMNHHNIHVLPFMDEFYHFFMGAFGIQTKRNLDCSNVSITVIWRRDYMSHPERLHDTGGRMHRKFKNEEEILAQIKTTLKGHKVREVILEEINMKKQLQLISETDILIGMHGAGMTHTLFLPSHAGVFELFPNYWGVQRHFEAMSEWRHLKYTTWMNHDERNEFPNFYTYIPKEIIHSHLLDIYHKICPKSA